jgi:hypothetical protein
MTKHFFILLMVLFIGITGVQAQELNAVVSVDISRDIAIADPRIIQEIEGVITEFLNNRSWTDYSYQPHERIDCNFQLNITSEFPDSENAFSGSLLISSQRPVFNSDYETKMFVHSDPSVNFIYRPGLPLRFSENSFINNLSSILSFYAYLIIAMDFDSYGLMAGEPYYQKAQNILNIVPELPYNGDWFPNNNNRNRFWLLNNFTTTGYRKFRQGLYKYHREGLDVMFEDAEKGRREMMDALAIMESDYNNSPNQMIYQLFSNAKAQEVVEIFKAAPSFSDRNKVSRTMKKFDPSKTRILNELK